MAIFKVSINLGRFKSQSKSYDHHAIKLEISSHSTEKISGNIWKVNKNTSKEIKDYLENYEQEINRLHSMNYLNSQQECFGPSQLKYDFSASKLT